MAIAATAPALESQIDAVRQHLRAVAQALPTVPHSLGHALRGLRAEVQAQGSWSLFGLLLAFAALGLGTERLLWLVSGRVRRWIIGARLDTPDEQFVIRRKALAMIKTAFDANGVKFAFPTVRIASGSEGPAAPVAAAAAAATQQGLGRAPA